MTAKTNFSILTQPDDTTCGPTCLHAIYNHFDDPMKITEVIRECGKLREGGTLAVMLALHALKRGYEARIYTYNLQVFDPSWFPVENPADLIAKLKRQMKHKSSRKLRTASKAYIEFLTLGGELIFEDLTRALLRKYLCQETPIITGLSATYLYRTAREYGRKNKEDDVRGEPTGHFVVLHDYDRETKNISVADPYPHNNMHRKKNYSIHIDRVVGAILLGIITYDANLLVINPKPE